uniref:LIM zinc-binding domain-containing protein n=1 Tax=Aegilops tauschii subsp. strangulata TaxID=200361 RepID=A0A453K2Z3_AEGTS
ATISFPLDYYYSFWLFASTSNIIPCLTQAVLPRLAAANSNTCSCRPPPTAPRHLPPYNHHSPQGLSGAKPSQSCVGRTEQQLADREFGRGNGDFVPGDDHQVQRLRQDGVPRRQAHRRQPGLPQGLLQVPPLQGHPQGTTTLLFPLPNPQSSCLIFTLRYHLFNLFYVSLAQLANYNSFEGVLYCRPHFDQLFKRTGSLDKSFEGTPKVVKPERNVGNENATKVSSAFAGTREKCFGCSKTVYPIERVTVNNTMYHKSCFKCCHGGCTISPSNYIAHEGKLFCKHHHTQLIKEKGNFSQLENDHDKTSQSAGSVDDEDSEY